MRTGFRRALVAVVALLLVPLAGTALAAADGSRTTAGAAATAAVMPTGFTDTRVTTVGSPTGLAFTPDGRILISTQPGKLWVYTNGALSSTPALDLTTRICAERERGLSGVTVDPAFASNRYIYVYYTFKKFGSCAFDSSSSPVNRVSRFTLADNNTVALSTELMLVDGIPSKQGQHQAGDVAFGKDGLLYITVGDGACDYAGDSGCFAGNDAARDPHVLLGKVLRVTSTGGIPPSNPYVGTNSARCSPAGVTDVGKRCQETFAGGLRNPFRFAFDPNAATTRFFINDVGERTWEEIDLGQAGADYGYNVREGFCKLASTTDCGPPPAGMTNPIYAYPHTSGCRSATGAAFVPAGLWPAEFQGAYLYGDFVCGKIFKLLPNGSGGYAATEFVTGLGNSSITAMKFGPSGSTQALYYLSYAAGGELRKIQFAGSANRAPTARMTASPTSGPTPLTVQFDGSASSDPDGDSLTYEWSFGDGSHATTSSPTVSYSYTTAGTYFAKLFVVDAKGAPSPTVEVRIDPGNNAPTPTITFPTGSTRFRVGQTLTLQGSATDPEDGTLPASALTWEVVLFHIDHTHPWLLPTQGNNIPIQAPAPEDLGATETSYLIVTLTATDSKGLKGTTTRIVLPKLVNVTLGSDPAGVTLEVNLTSFSAPKTFTSWEGYELNVNAPTQTTVGGVTMFFSRWSDGVMTPSRKIVTPASAASYTAIYGSGGGGSETTATFGVGASANDGNIEKGSSTYPPAAGATAYVGTTGQTVLVRRSKTSSGYTPVTVGLLRFNTSSLPDNAVISSAQLRVHPTTRTSTDNRSLVAEWYPAGNWPIDAPDWTNIDGNSAHSGTALGSITPGTLNNFALQNLSSINRTGQTALRLHISGHATAPTGPNDLGFSSFDHTTLPEPQLIVTYTLP